MATVLMFHHVQGLTPGLRAFADTLRSAGHEVYAPDLFGGRTFATIEDGFAFAQGLDRNALADAAVADLPADLVYIGFSLGVIQAQRLAQTRPGARGAVLIEAALPVTGEAGFGPWPEGVPVQIHGMDADEFFAGEGDLDAAREIEATVADAELFIYPGDRHLFADSSLPSYDADAAALLQERVLSFLQRVDAA